MQDSTQKYDTPKSKAWHGPCQMWHGRATSQDLFCCFFFSCKLLCFVV